MLLWLDRDEEITECCSLSVVGSIFGLCRAKLPLRRRKDSRINPTHGIRRIGRTNKIDRTILNSQIDKILKALIPNIRLVCLASNHRLMVKSSTPRFWNPNWIPRTDTITMSRHPFVVPPRSIFADNFRLLNVRCTCF